MKLNALAPLARKPLVAALLLSILFFTAVGFSDPDTTTPPAQTITKPSTTTPPPDLTPPAPLVPNGQFPTHPDATFTPGALCDNPTEYRYPEHIKYCARDVTTDFKRQVIRDYDQKFGYSVEQMPREDFKIDHFVPLCMGGANTEANLWPQHKTVYTISDPWEAELCGQLAAGTITQADAVAKIISLKMAL